MIDIYLEAANKTLKIAEDCEDPEAKEIIKNGCKRIFDLASGKTGFIKTASVVEASEK